MAVIQLAGLLHHEQTPCLSFSVQTLPQRLQCPCGAGAGDDVTIRLAPFELICPVRASVQVRALPYSVVKVLFVFTSLIIEQKVIKLYLRKQLHPPPSPPEEGVF